MSLWVQVLTTLCSLAAIVWAAGGRGELARKAIDKELDLAKRLPPGPARTAMEMVAVDRARRYAHRELGAASLRGGTKWRLAVVTGLSFAALFGLASISEKVTSIMPLEMLLVSAEIVATTYAVAGATLLIIDMAQPDRSVRAAKIEIELTERTRRRQELLDEASAP